MTDPIPALLELCELHYCPPEEAEAKAEAFLLSHGWAREDEPSDGKFGSKAVYHWWVKGSQKLGRSAAVWQEGRDVLQAVQMKLALDQPPAHGSMGV